MALPCRHHITFRPFSAGRLRHKLELLAAVHVSRGDNTYVSLFCACRQSNENPRHRTRFKCGSVCENGAQPDFWSVPTRFAGVNPHPKSKQRNLLGYFGSTARLSKAVANRLHVAGRRQFVAVQPVLASGSWY